MSNLIENFFELKSTVLKDIVDHGSVGVSESYMFRNLHEKSKQGVFFDYREGFTPDKLVESLIVEGDVVRVSFGEFRECRFIASERYFW